MNTVRQIALSYGDDVVKFFQRKGGNFSKHTNTETDVLAATLSGKNMRLERLKDLQTLAEKRKEHINKRLEYLKDFQTLAEKRKEHIQKMWNARKEVRELENKKVVDLTYADLLKPAKFEYTSFTDSLSQEQRVALDGFLKMTRNRTV